MHPLRTVFKKEIVAEFLPPRRKSNKVIIFCDGMPSVPRKEKIANFFSKKGYWFFHPRYRGTWESGGSFLKFSPEKDILGIIGDLPRGFNDAWSGKKYRVKPSSIYIIGLSFGGAAALLGSRDKRIKKIIAVSPVVDWKTLVNKGETIDWTYRFAKKFYNGAYRGSKKDSDKLKTGKFYNPAAHIKEIDGRKLFIVHAQDDKVIPFGSVQKFVSATGAKFLTLKKGGHLSSSILMKPRFYKQIKKFFGEK